MAEKNKDRGTIWQKVATITMCILTTILVGNSAIDYKMQPLLNKIEQLQNSNANKPDVRVIDTKEMVKHFSNAGYDTRTELEYIDILKILLNKSNIIAINENALQFKGSKYALKLNDIETLRNSLTELGIENPRVKNEAKYEEREKLQQTILNRLTKKITVQ
jgi:hypothetical protein